jgi:hypothetical protein
MAGLNVKRGHPYRVKTALHPGLKIGLTKLIGILRNLFDSEIACGAVSQVVAYLGSA